MGPNLETNIIILGAVALVFTSIIVFAACGVCGECGVGRAGA